MKRKITAWFISFAMTLSVVFSMPTTVKSNGITLVGFDTPFVLDENGNVTANWDQAAQTLRIKGNGKIVLNKWIKLAQKFGGSNFMSPLSKTGWNTNSNFTLRIEDATVQFPDKTNDDRGGFFENFQGKIEIADIDTSNVTDMTSMFKSIVKEAPDVSKWNTQNVKSMMRMFNSARKANPDVSKWNTSNLDNITDMFCDAIVANPDVSKWNTSNLKYMNSVFSGSGVIKLDLSNWDVSNLTNCTDVFSGTEKLKELKFKGFPKVTKINKFAGKYKVDKLRPDGTVIETYGRFNEDHEYIFDINTPYRVYLAENQSPIETEPFILDDGGNVFATWDEAEHTLKIKGNGKIVLSKWVKLAKQFSEYNFKDNKNKVGWNKKSNFTLKIEDATVQFPDKTKDDKGGFFEKFQGKIEIAGINTLNVTDMESMFSNIAKEAPDVSKWNTSNVLNMQNMFNGASLANPDVSKWDTSKVMNMSGMFKDARNANPDVSNWKTQNVTNMSYIFSGAENVTPDVSKWNTSNVLNMQNMFNGASLANPDVSKWDTSKVMNMSGMFNDARNANPDVSNWKTQNVKDMSCLFSGAGNANPDVSKWDTSNVINMSSMFSRAIKANPDVSKWDVSNVTDMSHMFRSTEYANPDVSKWNTSKVINMNSMFQGVIFANPDVSNWNTSEVINMSSMFQEAISANPDVSNWDISNVSDIGYMFYGATSANPDVSKWNTPKLKIVNHIFSFSGVTKLDLSNWDFSNIEFSYEIFENIERLELLKFKGIPEETYLIKFAGKYKVDKLNPDGSVAETYGPFEKDNVYTFLENTGYKVYLAEDETPIGADPFILDEHGNVKATWDKDAEILTIKGNGKIVLSKWVKLARKFSQDNFNDNNDKSGWNTNSNFTLKIEDATIQFPDKTKDDNGGFFEKFKGKIEIADIDTSNVTDTNSMFLEATSANPDVSKWDVSNVTDMGNMFFLATSAIPDVSNWKTSNVKNMSYTFRGITSPKLDVSEWDTSSVTDMSGMFNGVTNANPDVSKWKTQNVTNMNSMFLGAWSITPDVSKWDVSSVEDMSYMFAGAKSANPDVSKWKTSKVKNMLSMFALSNANPDVSEWDTSSVTNMSYMFSRTTSANPNVSKWKTSNVTDMKYMFHLATSANPNVSGWNTSNVTDMSSMFQEAISANPDVSNWDISNVSDIGYMFYGATSANPDVSKWNTPKLEKMSLVFYGSGATKLDLSNWDLSKIDLSKQPFENIEKLELLKFKGLPEKTLINKFIGKYKVDKLNSDGSVAETYGPFEKDNVYTFLENTGYNVYLAEDETPIGSDFILDEHGNVKATWDKDAEILRIKGNGKIVLSKWVELARKFSQDNFDDNNNKSGWNTNSNFTLKIEDATVQLPDKTKNDNGGFFEKFKGKIEIADIDTSNITDMESMFCNISKEVPNVSKWDTSNVTNMSNMFSYIKNVTPDVSNWNTQNVENMSRMFSHTNNINPDVSKWDVSNVKDMNSMFFQAMSANPDVSKWNVSNVTNMMSMFLKATSANPDVSKWNVSNVTNMSATFYNATNANPDVSKWNTPKLKLIMDIFSFSGATKLDLSNWDLKNITNCQGAFNNIEKLELLKFKGLPEETLINKFAGKYKVDKLNSDGSVAETYGPFEKDNVYTFLENTGYNVYLDGSNPNPNPDPVNPNPNPNPTKPNLNALEVKRMFGKDRYETAVKISQSLYDTADIVCIASGTSLADALNVSSYSSELKAPILLTEKDETTEEILNEISRLKATKIRIIGGENAISEKVENLLKEKGITVERIFGEDRYETALKVAKKGIEEGKLNPNKIFLCSGEKLADALSIASVAIKEKGIILLTDGNTLTAGVKEMIKSGVEVKIIGGSSAISDKVKAEVETLGAKVERIYGNDRFETSLEVYNKYYKESGVNTVYLANGIKMVDALTGSGLAGKDKTGILLVRENEMIPSIKSIVEKMEKLKILGGEKAIQDNIWR